MSLFAKSHFKVQFTKFLQYFKRGLKSQILQDFYFKNLFKASSMSVIICFLVEIQLL